ncbi:MAG: cohesin domain-containing protein [Bacteroidota bacterium]
MKTLILKIVLLSFLAMLTTVSQGQTIVATAGTVTSCPGEIQAPLNVTNCNGIGAISLVLFFDNTALTFIGYENLNTELTSGYLVVNYFGNKVVISWANSEAANIGNGTLMKLRFTTNATGTSNFTWDTQTPGNCEFSGLSGNILPSEYVNGTANINQSPSIVSNPSDQFALVGQSSAFSLSASGAGLGLQWQGSADEGATWNDLTNEAPYSNVYGLTLYISNVQLSLNGCKYRCKVTGACAPFVYTNAATLTVSNPVITALPIASFCPDNNIAVPVAVTNFNGVASFSITFSFNPAILTYTGFQNLNPALSGGTFVANSSSGKVYLSWVSNTPVSFGNDTIVRLLFSGITGYSNLSWDVGTPGNCEYSDVNGTLFTTVFTNGSATIYAIPSVVGNPGNVTIANGQNTTFSITPSGSGLSFQWQLSANGGITWTDMTNGGFYSNVTGTVLYVYGSQLSLSGNQYRCRVSGYCAPVVYSGSATLIVLPNIITTCQTVSNCPGLTVVSVNVTDFIEVGAFSLTLNFNPSILTYSGYQNLNPEITGGGFVNNSVAGKVYISWSGNAPSTISSGGTLIELKFAGITGTSSLNWDLQTPGNCEYSDNSGLIIFSTWNNGNVTIFQSPAITSQPVNASTYSEGNAYFSVGATGLGLNYQWQKSSDGGFTWSDITNTTPYSGANAATLSIIPATTLLNGYRYRCNVSGTCTPAVFSGSAILTVTPESITTTPANVTNSCTGNLSIPLNVTNFSNIGSISLTLLFDTTKMIYDGFQSVNSALAPGILVVNRNKNKVILSWASGTAANIGTGTLINYRFKADAGISTTLSWNTQTPGSCEYSDINGNIITSFYTNSTISVVSNSLMVNAGNDIAMTYPPVQLNGSATGGISPYSWQWSPSTWLTNPEIANPFASPHQTTEYVLTVTENNGCIASDHVNVTVMVSPVLSLQNITVASGEIYCYNATQTISVAGGGTTFVLQNGGSATLIAGQKINFLSGTKIISGGYMHAFITTNGQYCYGQLPPIGKSVISEANCLMPDSPLFTVFPNPTSGTVTVELSKETGDGPVYAELLGMRGEKIAGVRLFGLSCHEFSLSGKSAGMYFIRIICGHMTETKKIIKY